ncbi:hypothetical protein [Nonomuraea dietziae]|uniref:Uncharacterized protein n=1 Tax=Nonomuraea dietziae TaxID=65515 RepID=A0A7W5VJ25_9ACTN|nr:hypothetical protein [Nonomuraea dietziae]MBB3733065.1 hypothetical protein [Nonomuraea dietziae]
MRGDTVSGDREPLLSDTRYCNAPYAVPLSGRPAAATTNVTARVSRRDVSAKPAWKQMAGRLEEAGDDALVRVVTPADGHARLSVEKLGALGESPSLKWLRAACQAMLPRIDLPELLLEVHSWTGFLDAYVHLADISGRPGDDVLQACGDEDQEGQGRAGGDPARRAGETSPTSTSRSCC